MVMAMDEELRPQACDIAARLRGAGRSVDLVLESKKMKWAFKQAERCALMFPHERALLLHHLSFAVVHPHLQVPRRHIGTTCQVWSADVVRRG